MTQTQQERITVEGMTPEQLAAKVAELEGKLSQAGQDFIAFKANLRKEAMDMAAQHNLCAVVEQTLVKAGVSSVFRRVKVVTTVERGQTIDVPEELLHSYTEQELRAVVKRYLRDNLAHASAAERRAWQQVRLVSGPIDRVIGDAVVTIEEPSPDSIAGYGRFFLGNSGRVTHLVLLRANGTGASRHTASLCGKSPEWGAWRTDSDRVDSVEAAGHCRACDRRAREMGLVQ